MDKTTRNNRGTAPKQESATVSRKDSHLVGILSQMQKFVVPVFFVALWAVLAFYESALLQRTESFSLFLFDATYFDNMMLLPAGLLSYIGCFLIQFFHYPAVGAAIYVLLLLAVYCLVRKVFDIPSRYALLALLPVVAIVASNTQLGYWMFYLKMPGYYYMALLATLFSLLAMWAYKGLSNVWRFPLLLSWVAVGYPAMGVYALAAALLMALLGVVLAVRDKKGLPVSVVIFVFALLLIYLVPRLYYNYYSLVALDLIYVAGVPATQWKDAIVADVVYDSESVWHNIWLYWVPLSMLLFSMLLYVFSVALRGRFSLRPKYTAALNVIALVFSISFICFFWFGDKNFRIENKQMVAMWNEDWRAVADYAKDTEEPTRQIVLNKNIALYNLGRAGDEAFAYPDGGVLPVSPLSVHMTHTDGSSVYYNIGKFNYSYRWCIENSVEYGWKPEYLKNAARSMLLAGEYRLAERYIRILKSTMFHSGWANEMERFVKNPELVAKEPSFSMPLQFACFSDVLGVDDGVEMHMTSTVDAVNVQGDNDFNFFSLLGDAFANGDIDALNTTFGSKREVSPVFLEASLLMALVKKDSKRFWNTFNLFLANHMKGIDPQSKNVRNPLPIHFQEAVLLFLTLDKGKNVQIGNDFLNVLVSRTPGGVEDNFNAFQRSVATNRDAIRKQYPDVSETRINNMLAALLKDKFGDTYYYYYFFVKKIKTY